MEDEPEPPARPSPPRPSSPRRRAAIISSAIAVPVAVLLAFAFTAGRAPDAGTLASTASGVALAPLTIAPLPADPGADADCVKVIEKLPVTLAGLAPRRVFSTSANIVAWGDPPVVLECGVGRPAGLAPGSAAFVVDVGTGAGATAEWFPVKSAGATTLTTIDRAVYVRVTVPSSRQTADVLAPVSAAIAAALPAVCQAYPQPAPTAITAELRKSLCVYRK